MTVWTPEIVRSRFIEACDTERRLPQGGGGSQGAPWPSYVHSFEDMAGWGSRRLAEEREMRFKRMPPSAAAISRFEEVMRWSAALIHDDARRKIIWTWAACQVTGNSFAARCRKFGWVKMTAYRRLHAVSDAISAILANDGILLRMPDEKWLLPSQPVSGSDLSTLAVPDDDDPATHPHHEIADGARAGHTLTTPEAVASFEKFLERTNKARAKEQARRAKLKMLDAEVA